MKPTTGQLWALAAVAALASWPSRADVIWEANPSRGTGVFEGLERGQGTIDLVNDPKGLYGQVYHYNILDDADNVKDRVESRGHKLANGTNLHLTRGNTYYVGWRALWDRNVGTQPGKWVALWQMHAYGQPGMGAPFVFRTLGDGRLYLQNNVVGTNQHIWSTPLVRETWQRFVLRFHLDPDASRGWVELWYNGVPQRFINGQTRFFCPTHEDEAGTMNKLKWGLYRTGSASGVWHAYMSRARIGTTFEDVDPDGGTTGPGEITPPASGVNASGADGSNVAGNTVDNNLGTRWSGSGDAWIRYDLGRTRTITHVSIAVYRGDTRQNRFDLEVSQDGTSWMPVLVDALTSGGTLAEERFDFDDVPARYIRYVGHGSTVNTWNSVTELSVFGQ
jgi:hypothetical protein